MAHAIEPSIISIFEYYSNYIDIEKNSFKSVSTWDEIWTQINPVINKTISRVININSIVDNDKFTIKTDIPLRFPIVKTKSPFCDVNTLEGCLLKDLVKISFIKFYPHIIVSLCEEGVITITKELEVFYYLVKNYKDIKSLLSPYGSNCFKFFINYFYGKLPVDDRELVVGRGKHIITQLTKLNWVYADCDEIFIQDEVGVNKQIKDILDIIDFPYEIEHIKEMVIFGKKKYFSINSDSIGYITEQLFALFNWSSKEWRAGVIYSSHNRYPTSYQTVDIAVFNEDDTKILLARKPDENKYRFIGGFVDTRDASLEHAAKREFCEEASAEISITSYVGSFRVSDWRYRSERDKIMTVLFKAKYIFGHLEPSDDVSELRWFSVEDLRKSLKDVIEEHVPLMSVLLDTIKN